MMKFLTWLKRHAPNANIQEKIQLETLEDALKASQSRDGYVRERAVNYLAENPCATALQEILARLNDWVPQVRQAARVAFQRYLDECRADDLLVNLDNYLALRQKKRNDFSFLIQQTDDFLGQPIFHQRILLLFREHRGRTAHYLFRVLCTHGTDVALLQEALRHHDPSIRMNALDKLSKLPDEAVTEIAADMAQHGRPASLRSAALRLALTRMADTAAKCVLCRELLLDPSTGPRSTAGWYARQLGEDVEARYRTAASSEHLKRSVIVALLRESVTAKWPEGLQLAQRLHNHPLVDVRLAALHALITRTEGDEQYHWLKNAINDASPKIRKMAISSLRRLHSASSEAHHALMLQLLKIDPRYIQYLGRELPLVPGLGLMADLLACTEPPEAVEQILKHYNQQLCWFCEPPFTSAQHQWLSERLSQPLVENRLKSYLFLTEQLQQRGLIKQEL